MKFNSIEGTDRSSIDRRFSIRIGKKTDLMEAYLRLKMYSPVANLMLWLKDLMMRRKRIIVIFLKKLTQKLNTTTIMLLSKI